MEDIKVPTAEEFLESRRIYPHMKAEWECEAVYQEMIEFAKLHVKAALKEALESIPCLGSSSDIPTYEEVEKAVLNCYPENLI